MRHINCFTTILTLATSLNAFCDSPMTLLPDSTFIQIRSDGSGIAPYTLVNDSTKPLSQITIDPAYGGGNPSQLFLQNNTCGSTLASKASCTFQVLILGIDQSSAFSISPRACAYNGMTCAVATEDYRPSVTVVDITYPVNAYYAITSGTNENSLQPVLTSNQSLGTPIPGFDFAGVISSNDKSLPGTVTVGIDVAPNGETVYVPNRGSGNVSFVDVTQSPATIDNVFIPYMTKTSSTTIPPNGEPVAVVVTPNNNSLYTLALSPLSAVVINVPTQTISTVIPFAGLDKKKGCTSKNDHKTPLAFYSATISPSGQTVYMSTGNMIFGINTETNQVVSFDCVSVSGPAGLAIAPDNSVLYVANADSNTLGVLNATTLALVTNITVGSLPTAVAVSPNGSTVYVTNTEDNTLSVINAQNNTVIQTIALPYVSPLGLSLTPDGTLLYINYADSNFMSVMNTSTNQITSVNVGGNQGSQGDFVG